MPPLDRVQDRERGCIDHEEGDTSPKILDLAFIMSVLTMFEVFEKYLPPVNVT
jgi:hypothetical protein